jgi:hypothetical protein
MPSAEPGKEMDPRIREDDGVGGGQGDGFTRSFPSLLLSLPSFLRRQESMPLATQGKGMDPRLREDDWVAGLTVKVIEININALKAAINTLACDLHQQA